MRDNIDDNLWDAAAAGDEALVSQLIGQGPTVDWRGGFGATALHWTARHGHTPVVTPLWSPSYWMLAGVWRRGLIMG